MDINQHEIENILSRERKYQEETVTDLVDVFGLWSKNLNDAEKKEFLSIVAYVSQNLNNKIYEASTDRNEKRRERIELQRKELLELLEPEIDFFCTTTVQEMKAGEDELVRIRSLGNDTIKDTSYHDLLTVLMNTVEQQEIGKENMTEYDIFDAVLACFHGAQISQEDKEGLMKELCAKNKESIHIIYKVLGMLRKIIKPSDSEKRKLIESLITIAKAYMPDVDQDMDSLIQTFLESMQYAKADQKKIYDKFRFLFSFATSFPAVQEALADGAAYTVCLNSLLSLCDKETYKRLRDVVTPEIIVSTDKARVKRCLDDICNNPIITMACENGSHRAEEMRELLACIKDMIAKLKDDFFALSGEITRAFKLLMLEEDYKSMLYPTDKETKRIYYLLGAIDLLLRDKNVSYYSLAEKLRHDIIEGLGKQGLEYREVADEKRYIADAKSIPGDIELYAPVGENDDQVNKKIYTREDSEKLLLGSDDAARAEIEVWTNFLHIHKKYQTDSLDIYHIILYCIRHSERNRQSHEVNDVYYFIASNNRKEGQGKEGIRFLLSGGEYGITFLRRLAEHTTTSLIEEVGGALFLNFMKTAVYVDKVIQFTVAIATGTFVELLQTNDKGGEEVAKFIRQLSVAQIKNSGKLDLLFPYIKELGGEKLGKFRSEMLSGVVVERGMVVDKDMKVLRIGHKDEFIDLVRNGDAKTINSMIKEYGAEKLSVLPIKDGMYTRCGVPINKLEDVQTVLFKKIDSVAIEALSPQISFNEKDFIFDFGFFLDQMGGYLPLEFIKEVGRRTLVLILRMPDFDLEKLKTFLEVSGEEGGYFFRNLLELKVPITVGDTKTDLLMEQGLKLGVRFLKAHNSEQAGYFVKVAGGYNVSELIKIISDDRYYDRDSIVDMVSIQKRGKEMGKYLKDHGVRGTVQRLER